MTGTRSISSRARAADRDYRIRFEERELASKQIRGSHTIGEDTKELVPLFDRWLFSGVKYEWYYSDSKATTDIPTEVLISAKDTVDPITGDLISTSVRRAGSAADYRYTNLEDDVESYGWDLARPFFVRNKDTTVGGGWDYSRNARSLSSNRTDARNDRSVSGSPFWPGHPDSYFRMPTS